MEKRLPDDIDIQPILSFLHEGVVIWDNARKVRYLNKIHATHQKQMICHIPKKHVSNAACVKSWYFSPIISLKIKNTRIGF
ncbi:MAG: hypothetical protein HKO68_08385 [Desulfobacterales bacterium]|nr:hypothetical protein [Desulfobacterales bacterium]